MARKISENTKVTLSIGQIKDLVRESLNEVKENQVCESKSGVKDFDEVEIGDIGTDYNGIPCVIIAKGTASTVDDPTGTFGDGLEAGDMTEDQPSVTVQFFTGEKASYVYGDSGVTVDYENGNIKNINRGAIKETIGGTSDMADDQMLGETAEDDWLDDWLKEHPEDLQKTLDWINKTKPTMSQAGKEAWARNILKKRHREGKIDPEHPTAVEPSSSRSSSKMVSKEPRVASEEDEKRFDAEINEYANYSDGSAKNDPKKKWLWPADNRKWTRADVKRHDVKIKWYKPVGFDETGKVLLDVYGLKFDSDRYDSDGDYDDGKSHSWTDYHAAFEVDDTNKIGEDVGELKDKYVVLANGTRLEGAGRFWRCSWRTKDWWGPAHRDYYSTGGNRYYGRRRYWQE